jgi:hypothetical protein
MDTIFLTSYIWLQALHEVNLDVAEVSEKNS